MVEIGIQVYVSESAGSVECVTRFGLEFSSNVKGLSVSSAHAIERTHAGGCHGRSAARLAAAPCRGAGADAIAPDSRMGPQLFRGRADGRERRGGVHACRAGADDLDGPGGRALDPVLG